MGTPFSAVYDRFLGKITDDMYLELTPEDTLRDLQNLIIDAIPGFEFPRIDLYNYAISTIAMPESQVTKNDFVINTYETEDGSYESYVDNSYFVADLTSEEIDILAVLMMSGWVQRQLTSIENTRMKYSGSDFKFTSQANHLAKLQSLFDRMQQLSHHRQRLYKRRRFDKDGKYESNWSVLREVNAVDY